MTNEITNNYKKQIMIYASNEDAEKFKELQKQYKRKGMDTSALFHELMECYNKIKGGF